MGREDQKNLSSIAFELKEEVQSIKQGEQKESELEQSSRNPSKEAQARIEVALYASGRPLGLEELSKASRIASRKRLIEIMNGLAGRINGTFSAIELKIVDGPLYSLQLKPEFNAIAKRFATKPLLSVGALRTLSYVVYLQPVSTVELVQRRGSQVYPHLKELLEIGFVRAEKRGRGRVFTTTDLFADYFGLSRDPEQQRKQVANKGLISKAQQVEQKPVISPTQT
jgi:segregation and condensation protein B